MIDITSTQSDWQIVCYVVRMMTYFCSAIIVQLSLCKHFVNVRNDYVITEKKSNRFAVIKDNEMLSGSAM